MSSTPPGVRFHPTDEELLMHYLKRKILGQPDGMIPEIDVLKFEPWELHSKFGGKFGNKELFFFCQLKRKYPNSNRYGRSTAAGYWKPTGRGRPIKSEDTGVPIGEKRILVFHDRCMPNDERGSWVMHEYHLKSECLGDGHDKNKKLPYVACRIKNTKGKKPMMGHAPTSVNQEGDYMSFTDNQHDEFVAAHPELGESMDPSQRQDGILSNHNTIPANQSQAVAEEGWSLFLHFPNDNDGNELNSRPIYSPLSDPASYPNFPCSPHF